MSNFYSERQVKKTRKDHKCFGCREKLPKGSTVFYIAGTNDDGFTSCYLCIPCKEWIDNNPGEVDDEWREGDVWDARREGEREAKHD